MEANGIDKNMTDEFKHCLEGKAHLWYDEITIPEDWDDLMDMFCKIFCIYGRASENWYQQWNKICYDPNSDADIEEFISEIKTLKNLLGLPDCLVVTTLKEKFPTHRLHFINIDKLVGMYDMLRAMFLKNRTNSSYPSFSKPFASHQAVTGYTFQNKTPTKNKQSVSFHSNQMVEKVVNQLTETIEMLSVIKDVTELQQKNSSSPQAPCNPANCPYKPFITQGQTFKK